MIGNIAHQWRQPLSTITAVSSGMKMKKQMGMPVTTEEENAMYDMIDKSAQYLSKTIDTFRNYIKEEKELRTIILQDRINMTLDIVKDSLSNNHIKLINNIDNIKPIEITMIIGELSQVIINILNNSKDILMQKDIKDKWVKIDLVKQDNEVSVIIEDNGGGIPKDILSKIFDPYFTTKHKSQGTGLGLYMSKEIIEKSLNGQLSAKNSKNGAVFTIGLALI